MIRRDKSDLDKSPTESTSEELVRAKVRMMTEAIRGGANAYEVFDRMKARGGTYDPTNPAIQTVETSDFGVQQNDRFNREVWEALLIEIQNSE